MPDLRCMTYRGLLRFLFFLVLSLTACASMPLDMVSPKVHIVKFAFKEFTMFEQRFDVQLRIHNPNNEDLTINGMRFDIDVNSRDFANGLSGEKVVVPRFGSEVVNVEIITGVGSFLRQLRTLNKSGPSQLQYRIKGTAFVESPGTFKMPFDERGEIDFSSNLSTEKNTGDTRR